MVSLLLLKPLYDYGDETAVEGRVQNPYWQYFSGESECQWNFPCDPSDRVHFRHKIAEDCLKIAEADGVRLRRTYIA